MLADLRAMRLKATRSGVGGPHPARASGLNRLSRAVFGRFAGPLIRVGDKVSPVLTVVGAFTAAYNGTIEAQCALGVIE